MFTLSLGLSWVCALSSTLNSPRTIASLKLYVSPWGVNEQLELNISRMWRWLLYLPTAYMTMQINKHQNLPNVHLTCSATRTWQAPSLCREVNDGLCVRLDNVVMDRLLKEQMAIWFKCPPHIPRDTGLILGKDWVGSRWTDMDK